MTHNGIIRDGRIELDQPIGLPNGQRVQISVETVSADHAGLRRGSPARLLEAMRTAPPVSDEDVAAMLDSINAGRLPPSSAHPFEDAA